MSKIDWNAARTEYIAGGISQRALAEKYGVSRFSVQQRAKREDWTAARKEAQAEYTKKAIQKTADVQADNAAIAVRILGKLLEILENEILNLPESIGTETIIRTEDGTVKTYRLRDLTAAYRDLAAQINTTDNSGTNELLLSLLYFEREAAEQQ